jgi:hypothetical protein
MSLTVTKRIAVPVDTLRMVLNVRYGDEDMPNDFPFRKGDTWAVEVDIATGKIKDWPTGRAFDLYMKVCDEGRYYLLADGDVVAEKEGDYVPNSLVPGEYGDYVELTIAADGTITNWPKAPDLSAFDEDGR